MDHFEEYYKQKYIKYKNKYLQLKKEIEGGALLARSGKGAIFSTSGKIQNMVNSLTGFNKDSSTIYSFQKRFDQEAYLVYEGDNYMTLLENSERLAKEKISAVGSKVGSKIGSTVKSAASSIARGASTVATKTNQIGMNIGASTTRLADRVGNKISSKIPFFKSKGGSDDEMDGGSPTSAKRIDLGFKVDLSNPNHIKTIKEKAREQGIDAQAYVIVKFNTLKSNELLTSKFE